MTLMKTSKPATVEDLLRMPKDGRIHELVDGEIIVSPAGMRHSEIAANILHGRFIHPTSGFHFRMEISDRPM